MVALQKIELISRTGAGKRKRILIKDDVSGDENSISGEIQAPISFVIGGIAEEHTKGGARRELVGSSSREVRVAGASEDPKMIVGRGFPEEGEVGSTVGKGFGGETIQKVGRSLEAFNPIGSRKGGLEQHGANDVVHGADHAFCLAILRRRVGTGHPEHSAMVKEEGASGGVVELAPVVALNLLNSIAKLGRHIRKKGGQGGKRFRL